MIDLIHNSVFNVKVKDDLPQGLWRTVKDKDKPLLNVVINGEK